MFLSIFWRDAKPFEFRLDSGMPTRLALLFRESIVLRLKELLNELLNSAVCYCGYSSSFLELWADFDDFFELSLSILSETASNRSLVFSRFLASCFSFALVRVEDLAPALEKLVFVIFLPFAGE